MSACRRLMGVVFAYACTAGCSGGVASNVAEDAAGRTHTGSGNQQTQQAAAVAAAEKAPMPAAAGFRDQAEMSARKHGEVVATAWSKDRPEIAVVATFNPRDQSQSAQCPIAIYEYRNGQAVEAASSDALLSCELEDSAEQARRPLKIVIGREFVSVAQQFAKKNSSFKIDQDASGVWRVVEAEFNYPQYDVETDEMRVISERAAYPSPADGVLLSDYSYGKIKPVLVRAYVE